MTIAVDFDGVIHAYSRGWADGTIYDPPMPGALDGLRELMTHDAVFIFTTRDVSQVAEWLIGHQFNVRIGYDGLFWNERGSLLVTNRKLAATAYLDDRAVRFESWAQTLAALLPGVPEQLPRDEAPLTVSQANEPEAHQPLPPERPPHGHAEGRRCARCGDRIKLFHPAPGPLNPGPGWVHLGDEPRCHAATPATYDGEQQCPTPLTHNWGCGCPTDQAPLEDLRERAALAETACDGAYRERAQLLAWLATFVPAVITPAADVDEPGWQLLYLNPGGTQLTWHISPLDADLFAHVEHVNPADPRVQWDGHSTEEKYERIALLAAHAKDPLAWTKHEQREAVRKMARRDPAWARHILTEGSTTA